MCRCSAAADVNRRRHLVQTQSSRRTDRWQASPYGIWGLSRRAVLRSPLGSTEAGEGGGDDVGGRFMSGLLKKCCWRKKCCWSKMTVTRISRLLLVFLKVNRLSYLIFALWLWSAIFVIHGSWDTCDFTTTGTTTTTGWRRTATCEYRSRGVCTKHLFHATCTLA